MWNIPLHDAVSVEDDDLICLSKSSFVFRIGHLAETKIGEPIKRMRDANMKIHNFMKKLLLRTKLTVSNMNAGGLKG